MKPLKRTALATGIAMALSGTAYADLNNGLVAHYPFDKNAQDMSSNGYHGTEHGNITYVPGVLGEAVKLTNFLDMIELPNSSLNGKVETTVAMWLRLDDHNVDGNTLLSGANASIHNEYFVSVPYGRVFPVPHNEQYFAANTRVDDQEFHHVVVITSANSLSVYIDGQFDRTASIELTPFDITSSLWLGMDQDEINGGFQAEQQLHGTVDELRFYNRVLSECEIESLYTGKDECPPSDVCQLYGVQDNGLNDSQLFTINLDTLEVNDLGEQYPGYDIEALAIHPVTGELYAASGDDTDRPGYLYKVNTHTGELTEIGNTGFAEIEGLSFDKDGTLWAWAKGDGLIQIDTQTGVGTLMIPSPVAVEDITWNNDSTLLYAAQDKHLWVYDGNAVKKTCDLPGHTEALEMLPNNTLLVGIHGQTKLLEFQAIDLTTCETVLGVGIPTHYDDMEGIAYPVQACAK